MNQLLHRLINNIYLEKWVLQQVQYNYGYSSWYVWWPSYQTTEQEAVDGLPLKKMTQRHTTPIGSE
jgi:hypothetical protein